MGWALGVGLSVGAAQAQTSPATPAAPSAGPTQGPSATPFPQAPPRVPESRAGGVPSAPAGSVRTMTFTEALERALARNPTLAQARADVRRAEGVLRSSRAPALPTLTANGTYTRLDADRVLGGAPGTPPRIIAGANQLYGNVLLSVPILNVNGWLVWGQAEDNVEVSRVTAEDARRTTAVSTGRAFLNVLAAHRVVEASEQAVTTAREHFEFANRRYGGGIGRSTDVVRAEQDLAVAAAQLETSVATLARAQEALGVFVAEDGPVDAVGELPRPELPALGQASAEALQARQDVRAAQERFRVAERIRKDSWAEYMPTVTGTFAPFYQDPPTLTNPQLGWQAQLVFTLPLYDGGARYGRKEQREAAAEQAQKALEQVRRQTLSDVRISYVALERADAALAATRRAADLAREAVRLTNLSYEAGAATNLELIDAQRRLRDAEISVAVAENTARQARLDLLAACGRFP